MVVGMSDVCVPEIFESGPVETIGAAPTSTRRSASKDRVEVITRGARRRWSTAEKRAIVEASLVPGVVVSGLCRRHEISSGQLSTWRRQYRDGDLVEAAPMVPGFARALVSGASPGTPAAEPADAREFSSHRGRRRTRQETIEITLPDGVVLRVGAGVDGAALRCVLAALRGA